MNSTTNFTTTFELSGEVYELHVNGLSSEDSGLWTVYKDGQPVEFMQTWAIPEYASLYWAADSAIDEWIEQWRNES